jgi:hypothetical protein
LKWLGLVVHARAAEGILTFSDGSDAEFAFAVLLDRVPIIAGNVNNVPIVMQDVLVLEDARRCENDLAR